MTEEGASLMSALILTAKGKQGHHPPSTFSIRSPLRREP